MAIQTKKLTEVDVLDAATENTHVLAVENGTVVQLPASSLGQGESNENNSVVPCIVGSGYPISTGGVFVSPPISEKPAVGSMYLDKDNLRLLVCTAIDDVDTWVLVFGNRPEEVSDGTLITFRVVCEYIEGLLEVHPKTYLAISGMTWDEWCESEYNTDGFVIQDGVVYANLEGYDTLDGASEEYEAGMPISPFRDYSVGSTD